jgi:hypothetical protein
MSQRFSLAAERFEHQLVHLPILAVSIAILLQAAHVCHHGD